MRLCTNFIRSSGIMSISFQERADACSLIRIGHFHVGRDGPNSKGNPTHNITALNTIQRARNGRRTIPQPHLPTHKGPSHDGHIEKSGKGDSHVHSSSFFK